MGIWTEAVIACELKRDTPPQVIDVLRYMNNPINGGHFDTPQHPFFRLSNWFTTLAMDCAYFPGEPVFILEPNEYTHTYHLTLRCKVKYGELVSGLIHWLAPYIATQGILGYRREDEVEEITLISANEGSAYYATVPSLHWSQVTSEMYSQDNPPYK